MFLLEQQYDLNDSFANDLSFFKELDVVEVN